MEYRVGDKVRVKENLVAKRRYGCSRFDPEMKKYCGKTFVINNCCICDNGDVFYRLENALFSNGVYWCFTDEMLEPARQTYTLQECIDNNYAIHCDTEDKANKLMKALDDMGRTWRDGTKYTQINLYCVNEKNSCYTPYEGMEGDTFYYKAHNIKIVYFDDVILPKDYKDELASVLDKAERAYLEAVIKPFKDKVCGIIKCTNYEVANSFFIAICIPNNSPMLFPPFHTKMYVGMKLNKPYTLQELGLFQDGLQKEEGK